MEPLGTITKYYPFIEEGLQKTLTSLMEESQSYFGFVLKLANHVLENDVHPHLAYIAAVQSWQTRVVELMDAIALKFHDFAPIQPWKYPFRVSVSDPIIQNESFQQNLYRGLEGCNEDWILVELHLLDGIFKMFTSVPESMKSINAGRKLVEANENLMCFCPWALIIEARASRRECPLEHALDILEKARTMTEKYDDRVLECERLMAQAWIKRDTDIQTSLDLYEQSYSLAHEMEVPFLLASVMDDCSIAYELSGEFDLAIASAKESMDVYQGNLVTPLLILARIFSRLGIGEKAQQCVGQVGTILGNTSIHVFHLRKALAFLLLNKLDDAEEQLEIAYPLVLRTDLEVYLSEYYHVTGLLEFARGELHNSLNTLQKSLEILERRYRPLWEVPILRDLASVEITISLQSEDKSAEVVPGHWLNRLETQVNKYPFPGLMMEFALCKSHFYLNTGQIQDARQILADALALSDSDAYRTLRRQIEERIGAIDVLKGH